MGYEVQQTRWDRIVRRVSGSIGGGSRVSETLTELFPMFDVENVPAELLVLGGTRMAMGFTLEPASAVLFQVSQLFNPVGSGAIIRVTELSVITDAADVGIGLTTGSFTTDNPTRKGFTDGRLIASIPVGQVRDETAGASGVIHYILGGNVLLNGPFRPPNAVAVLSPGTGLSVTTRAVNLTLNVNYTWLERPAEESELSL